MVFDFPALHHAIEERMKGKGFAGFRSVKLLGRTRKTLRGTAIYLTACPHPFVNDNGPDTGSHQKLGCPYARWTSPDNHRCLPVIRHRHGQSPGAWVIRDMPLQTTVEQARKRVPSCCQTQQS